MPKTVNLDMRILRHIFGRVCKNCPHEESSLENIELNKLENCQTQLSSAIFSSSFCTN